MGCRRPGCTLLWQGNELGLDDMLAGVADGTGHGAIPIRPEFATGAGGRIGIAGDEAFAKIDGTFISHRGRRE